VSNQTDAFLGFHTIHADPDEPVILPGNLAEKLATRPDYMNGPVRTATADELKQYNAILKDKGKEAAKQWLTEQWA